MAPIGSRKCREDGIALGIDLDSGVRGDGTAQHAAMLFQCGGVGGLAEVLQQLRRAFHIGEKGR